MSKRKTDHEMGEICSRRAFLAATGAAAAGLAAGSLAKPGRLFAASPSRSYAVPALVAATQAFDYERANIKARVQHLFEVLGGIGDVIKPGDKVAIKINITGGTSYEGNARLKGLPLIETVWTHPEVLRAVGELILDAGVRPQDLFIVEAIWGMDSYNDYGYKAVQDSLGATLVDLNKTAPYGDFADQPVGSNFCDRESIKLNRILTEVNAFVSIPKMKHHLTACVTHSMKNLIGIVPLLPEFGSGWRSKLHSGITNNDRQDLQRAICDLNMARPIHLAIIDGIKTADGGELPTATTFVPKAYNLLLAGKDPVATDSIASLQMGNDPEAEQLFRPDRTACLNYLALAREKGIGTNLLSEIQVVGDGAGAIRTTSVKTRRVPVRPDRIVLSQNFPNPFNSTTAFRYFLPETAHVTIRILDASGRRVAVPVDAVMPAGEHEVLWSAGSLPSGTYLCRMQTGRTWEVRKFVLQR
jgi:uncharacterized protein (DUF362 family)